MKEWLFPRYKGLKDGWMEYDDGPKSLPLSVWRKVKTLEWDELQGSMGESIMPNNLVDVHHYKV
jgi:hypothetical protein